MVISYDRMENTRKQSIWKRTKLQLPKQSNRTTTTQHTNHLPQNTDPKPKHRKTIRPNHKTNNPTQTKHKHTNRRSTNTGGQYKCT